MWKPVLTSVLAIGLAAGLTACSGDDDDGDALTKDEFIEQGDELCTQLNDDIADAFGEFEEDASYEESQAMTRDKILPLFEEFIDDMRALEPPADDEELAALLDNLEAGGERAAEVVEMSEEDAIAAGDPFGDVDTAAQEYGFKVCGTEDDADA